jgi:hypothetical protein
MAPLPMMIDSKQKCPANQEGKESNFVILKTALYLDYRARRPATSSAGKLEHLQVSYNNSQHTHYSIIITTSQNHELLCLLLKL